MDSGSLKEMKRIEKVFNYELLKNSIIQVLHDVDDDFDISDYDPQALDTDALVFISNLVDENKLKKYVLELIPDRIEMN